MKQKLTLTVEEAMIIKAKEYAKHCQKSVSEIVEDLFATFPVEGNEHTSIASNKYPLTAQLSGCVESLSDQDINQLKSGYLLEKYLHD